MKILVTGGTGYIGSHTVVELINAGYEVIVVDNLCNSRIGVLEQIHQITNRNIEFVKLELANKKATKLFFEQHQDISSIIHFAALKAVGESVEKPIKYFDNNINSLLNILEGMRQNEIKNLVFSSSCTVYGQPEKLPVSENTAFGPAYSAYGLTKQISEQMIQMTNQSFGFNCIALRYFNPIGSHPTALIGEYPLSKPNNLVPFITQTAIGKRKELQVFGDDYNTPDGTAIRDYIHIVDLAQAHVVAVNRLQEHKQKSNYEVFNLGTGNGFSVLEVIQSFEKVTGQKLPYRVVGRRAGDIEKVWADATLAKDELGWTAKYDLDSMMASAWEWEKYIKEQKIT